MSDLTYPFAVGLPTGRVVNEDDDRYADGVVFVISQFPRATAKRIEAARKHAREIPDERLDRSTDPWTDRADGMGYELVKSFFNVVDPAESGAVAFTISDGNLLGLRPAGYEHPVTSQFVGNLAGDGSRV